MNKELNTNKYGISSVSLLRWSKGGLSDLAQREFANGCMDIVNGASQAQNALKEMQSRPLRSALVHRVPSGDLITDTEQAFKENWGVQIAKKTGPYRLALGLEEDLFTLRITPVGSQTHKYFKIPLMYSFMNSCGQKQQEILEYADDDLFLGRKVTERIVPLIGLLKQAQ